MYCKKCGVNYKKDKKVCPRCGAALLKGEFKGDPASRRKKIMIIACAAAVLVIALFLVIFIIGRVPPKLAGTWYEINGYGYIEFKPNHIMTMSAAGTTVDGTYDFDNEKGEGTIIFSGEEDDLTCDGSIMYWSVNTLTKAYVEQIEYDWDAMLDQAG